jgi:thymidine phosphorylase
MSNYLTRAIKYLKPSAEFVITNEDYSTIEWHQLEGDVPTQAEIDEAIEQVKDNEIAEAQAKAQAKAVLLERLGLTQEEFNTLIA